MPVKKMRNNKEIVLIAVEQTCMALEYASEEMKNIDEVLREVIH